MFLVETLHELDSECQGELLKEFVDHPIAARLYSFVVVENCAKRWVSFFFHFFPNFFNSFNSSSIHVGNLSIILRIVRLLNF